MTKLKNTAERYFLEVLGYSLDSRDRAKALQAPVILYHFYIGFVKSLLSTAKLEEKNFMLIQQQKIKAGGVKFFIMENKKEIARAYLYILKNDSHREPFGFLEDMLVEEKYRRQGLGAALVKATVAEAKKRGCYKLIATSRHSRKAIHRWYKKLGFEDYGLEFRVDFG